MASGARIGPYVLGEVLGRGGMGVVHRAVHAATGTNVALKTVRVPAAPLVASIRREVRSLMRIEHPGVVRIVDEGIEKGRPWFAMELLQGRSLRELMIGAASGRESEHDRATERLDHLAPTVKLDGSSFATTATPTVAGGGSRPGLLDVMRRLCAPLAFLHGEGLVHGDLKPENVLVKADGSPVIVDFGLASRFSGELSRESLEQTSEGTGTVWYMAPEQLLGELIDARADLYALGCMLYEALTGAPPFTGGSPMAVAQGHLTGAPVPPATIDPTIAPELDDLVLHLLEKHPDRRIGHADAVAARLPRGNGGGAAATAPRARPYLYRPPLCGRDELRADLLARLRGVEEGRGQIVLLGGESGSGKTRLALEIAAAAGRRGATVLLGECPAPTDGHRPLGAFAAPLQAIGDRCRELDGAERERILGRRAAVLSLYEPSLKQIARDLGYAEPPGLGAEAARIRLQSDLVQTLRAMAAPALLLVLDDLHHADDLTLGVLELLVSAEPLRDAPMLVLATYRVEEADVRLRALAASATELRLPRLSPADVTAISAGMLAMEPPRALTDLLVARASGNPLLVAEHLRAAVAEGLLAREATGGWRFEPVRGANLELAPSVRALLARRLAHLDPVARVVAAEAAVFGVELEEAWLREIAAERESELDAALAILVDREVLLARGAGRLRFAHEVLVPEARAGLAPDRRRELHGRAARVLGAIVDGDHHLASIAGHLREAGEMARARQAYAAAASHAGRRHAYEEELELLRAGLALAPEPDRARARARQRVATVLRMTGRMDDALVAVEESLREARAIDDAPGVGEALRESATIATLRAEYDAATRTLDEALAHSRAIGDRDGEAGALTQQAVVRQMLGDVDEGERLFGEALRLRREIGDEAGMATVLADLSVFYLHRGRMAEARRDGEAALAIMRRGGDRQSEIVALANLAVLYKSGGDRARATEMCREALRVAREIGDRRSEGNNLGHLAVFAADEGRWEESLECHHEALAIHRETCNRRFQIASMLSIGSLLRQDGRVEEALDYHRRAAELNEQVRDRVLEGVCRANMGIALAALGRRAEARTLLEAALDIQRELDYPVHQAMTLRFLATFARQAEGDIAAADGYAREAEQLLASGREVEELARLRCVQGHIALAKGESGRAELDAAVEVAQRSGAGPQSPLGRAIGRLREAVAAAERGEPLLRGEPRGSLSPELLSAIEQLDEGKT